MSDGDTREAQDKPEEYSKEENSTKDSHQRDGDVQHGEDKGGANRQNEQTDTESASAMDALEPESGHAGSNADGTLPNTHSKPVSKDSMDEEKVSVGSGVEQTGSAVQGERVEQGDHVDDIEHNHGEKGSGEHRSSDSRSQNAMPDSEDTDTEKTANKGQDIAVRGDNHVGVNEEQEEGRENELQSRNDGSGDEENKTDDVTTEISQSQSQDPDQSQENRSEMEEIHNRLDERMEKEEREAKAHDQSSPDRVNTTPERSQTQTEMSDTPARDDETVNTRMDSSDPNPSQTQTQEETSDSRIAETRDVRSEHIQPLTVDPDKVSQERSDEVDTNPSQAQTQEETSDSATAETRDVRSEHIQQLTVHPDQVPRDRSDEADTNPSQTQTQEETSDSATAETLDVRSEHIQPQTVHPDKVPQERSDEGEGKGKVEGDADSGAGLDDKASGLSEEMSASQTRGDEGRGEERVISNSDNKANIEELQETGSTGIDERPEQMLENGHSHQDSDLPQGNYSSDTYDRLPRESENGSLNAIGIDSTEAKNSRGNAEDNQRQQDIDSRDNQEISSLDGRKKDENGDFEFETSSLSHTESEATRGQPPISTVYVKAPRKQSDPESCTANSQDEIEIVSQANRQDGDQQGVPKEESGKETDATEDVRYESEENRKAEVEEKVEDQIQEKDEDEVKQEVREDVASNNEGQEKVEEKVEQEVQGDVVNDNEVQDEDEVKQEVQEEVVNDDVDGEQGEVGVESDVKVEETVETEDQNKVVDNCEAKDAVGKDVNEVGEVGERDKAENGEVGEEEVEHRKENVTHESVKDDDLDKEVKVESEVTDKVERGQNGVENDKDESADGEEEEDSSSEDDDETDGDSEDDTEDDKKSALVPGEKTVQSSEVQAGQQTVDDARGKTRKESTVSDIPPPPAAADKSESSIKDEERGTQPEEERISIKEDSKSIRSTRSAQSRGSVGKSRQSLRASRISVEKDVKPEVKDAPVDAAQAPETRREDEEQDKKSVATSRASLTETGTGDNDAKADSKSIVSQGTNEKDNTTIHTEATDIGDKEPQQSSVSKPSASSREKEPVRETKRYENKQERKKAPPKSDGRGRVLAVSPRRSSSPQRSRGSYRSEVKSARRSPRETSSSRTRSPTRPRTTTTSRSYKGGKSNGRKTTKKSPREETRGETPHELDGRSKQREFFKEELRRLEEALKREKSKIIKPDVKKHTPYIFNTLEPYYNTSTVRYLLELPEEVQHRFVSRKTAIGLCDPWVDYDMDTKFLPRISSSARAVNRQHEMEKRDEKIRERERRSKKEGSTRLPKFPVVTLDSKEYATKPLYYSDVPELRRELRDKYSQNATKKIDEDYTRTKQDFYRMDLDKLDEVHPLNRPHMRNAYFAYLQNTPGSRKAIVECVKGLKAEGKAN